MTVATTFPPPDTEPPTKTKTKKDTGSDGAHVADALADQLTGSSPPPALPFDDLVPSIVKAVDPVATMTNKSFNAGIKKYKASFYSEAVAECNRLVGLLQQIPADSADGQKAAKAVSMLQSYASLYAGLEKAGAKASDAAVVASLYASAEVHVYGLSVDDVGAEAHGRILQAFNEIGVFVDSWSDVKAAYGGGKTALSSGMWAAFLQTVERERQILKEYGLLQARGGDTKGTGQRAIMKSDGSGTMTSSQDAQARIDEDGGVMAAALETYGTHARNMEKYKEQIYAVQQRILAGEFETMEESVEAFKKTVGGGRTSNAFLAELEALASGTWSIAMADKHQADEKTLLDGITRKQSTADRLVGSSKAATQASASQYVKHKNAADDTNKPDADAAWEKAMAYKSLAEGRLHRAEVIIQKNVPQMLDAAASAHSEANVMLQNARNFADAVDTERFSVLTSGVQTVQVRADQVESKLRQNEKSRKLIEETNAKISQNAKTRRDAIDQYNPTQMKVPGFDTDAVEASGGSNVSTEVYSSLKVGLEGAIPGAPFMKLFGGFKAELGRKNEKGEKWTTEAREHEFGVKIDLFLFEIVFKYVGGLKGALKGKGDYPGPVDTYNAITEERANLEAAHDFDKGGYLKKLIAALDTYPGQVQKQVWDPLFQLAPDVGTDKAGARDAFNDQVDTSAERMTALWGSDSNKVGFHGALDSTFGHLVGFWENWIQQFMLNDGDHMAAEILKLKQVDDEAISEDVVQQHSGWKTNSDKVVGGTKNRLSQISFLNNNPDVTVESYDAVEIGAKAGITKSVSGEVSYRHTWSKKDGDGEFMDTNKYKTDLWKLKVGLPFGEVEGSYKRTQPGNKTSLGLEGKLIAKVPDDAEEQEKAASSLTEAFKAMKNPASASGEMVLTQAMNYAEKYAKGYTKIFKAKEGASMFGFSPEAQVSFGVEFSWKKGVYEKCQLSLGFERKNTIDANMGAVKGSAEFLTGSKVTWEI